MTAGHAWVRQEDGTEKCANNGCTIRRFMREVTTVWQVAKGGHWRNTSRQPIPECRCALRPDSGESRKK